ncbi:hypothetical protein LEP1GSC047_2050 [Leptospira inadai serovar Lyme str. 10]|uniref:Uncharacterized protein n=1 Tax=Leptospira inadai serovar Lyme str. 10 TaxID=1049790 RepID=V6HFE4_9LEPT|nr:hypothetical protein LEP1GSC047_2050 [Leptospira inadai serovar Lyme str. 10]
MNERLGNFCSLKRLDRICDLAIDPFRKLCEIQSLPDVA